MLGGGTLMARHSTANGLKGSESLFFEFFKDSNVGLATFDPQLCYRTLNACLAASHRAPAESHLRKHVREILGTVAPQVEPAIQQVFETRKPVMNRSIAGPLPTRPDAGHWISNFFPIADENGRVLQVGAVVVELGKDIRLDRMNHEKTSDVLRSWKDIANYVGTCVKTVQRWEHTYHFPVRRVEPGKGAVVFALQEEVDQWLRQRSFRDQRR
jgi:predicted DNA-binding transcriptional regulator AlpA